MTTSPQPSADLRVPRPNKEAKRDIIGARPSGEREGARVPHDTRRVSAETRARWIALQAELYGQNKSRPA